MELVKKELVISCVEGSGEIQQDKQVVVTVCFSSQQIIGELFSRAVLVECWGAKGRMKVSKLLGSKEGFLSIRLIWVCFEGGGEGPSVQ